MYGKKSVTRPPFISHYAIIQGEMGLFLTFKNFELQRGYLYQNGVEFRQKVIGAGLNLFWGHLHYSSEGIQISFAVGHISDATVAECAIGTSSRVSDLEQVAIILIINLSLSLSSRLLLFYQKGRC